VTAQRKPYDLGNGLLCASFATDGSWLSVSAPHPRMGLLELSGAPAFSAERDGQVDLVRAHRAHLTEPSTAFLLVTGASDGTEHGAQPRWVLRGEGWTARVDAWAQDREPAVVQRYLLSTDGPGVLRLEFRGRLDRPAYAEITPGGPIPPSLPAQILQVDACSLRVRVPLEDDDPSALVDVAAAEDLALDGWQLSQDRASLSVSWDAPLVEAPLLVSVTMTCGEQPPSPRATGWRSSLPSTAPPPSESIGLERVQRGASRYTLDCTALEVALGQCCILTDHRLLPLSWTRDAYYQAALLLAVADEVPEATAVVERHLEWLWRSSRDGGGVWRRSHFSTGRVKDHGYQVDQQLFPLLELADFRRSTGRWPGAAGNWGEKVRRVWGALPRDANGLVPGEENPADDPSELPYLLSSQLLLAYVARRLAEYENELGPMGFAEDAHRTLGMVRSTFTCAGPFGDQWAYEADGLGGHRLYHDANDVPTALAPLWGLCDPDDPQWRATMRFAYCEHNPGFVPGVLPGLGSAHTPGVWPLGDAQEWAVAVAEEDRSRAAAVVARLEQVASADGMLPETYDVNTGDWLARHWFAWPGSLVGLMHATFVERRGPWVTP
jgi:hypothetical protein